MPCVAVPLRCRRPLKGVAEADAARAIACRGCSVLMGVNVEKEPDLTDQGLQENQPAVVPESAPVSVEQADLGTQVRPRRSRVNLILGTVACLILAAILVAGYSVVQETKLQDVPQTLADVNIMSIRRAIEANPAQLGLYLDLAGAYYDVGRYDDALATLQKLESSNPKLDPQILALSVYGRGKIAAKTGDNGTALGDYTKSLEITETPDARYALGTLYVQRRQFKEAVEQLERYVALQPGEGDGLIQLARAYEGAGDPTSALKTYETATTFLADDPELEAAIARLKGQQ